MTPDWGPPGSVSVLSIQFTSLESRAEAIPKVTIRGIAKYPTAMRDLRLRHEKPGSTCTPEQMEEWRLVIKSFLEEEEVAQGAADSKRKTPAKIQRVATFDLACGADRQLKAMTGEGWKRFRVDGQDHAQSLLTRPRMTVIWDMGPDNLCLTGWMMNHAKLRCSVFFSICHKCQRALWHGVQHSGMYAIVLVGGIVANLERGPFEGEATHQKLRESCEEFVAKARFDDPLLQLFGPRILLDRQESPHSWSDATAQDVLDNLLHASWRTRKPPRTAITQWNTWLDAFEYIKPEWHERLLALTHMGVCQGWDTAEKQARFAKMLKPTDAKGLKQMREEKMSTKEAHKRTQKMRDLLRSAHHIACYAMGDIDFFRCVNMILIATEPWRHFAGLCQKEVTGPAQAREFFVQIVRRQGHFWRFLSDAVNIWRDEFALERMGFVPRVTCNADRVYLDNSVEMEEQRRLARKFWRLVLTERKEFLRGFNHYYDGYPAKFARLLAFPGEQETVWKDLLRDYLAFQGFLGTRDAYLKKLVKRSFFNWPEISEMFNFNGGRLHPDHIEYTERILYCHGDSTCCERKFQLKSLHQRDSQNLRISPTTLWKAPVRQQTLTKEYNFEAEVNSADCTESMPAKDALPPRLHQCVYHKDKTSMPLTDITGRNKTPWDTHSPETWHTLVAEAHFLRFIVQNRITEFAAQAWRTELLREFTVIERENKLWMVAVSVPPMVYLWPVKQHSLGPDVFLEFEPAGPDTPVPFCITAFNDIRAVPYEFTCPMHMLVANKLTNFPMGLPSFFGVRPQPHRNTDVLVDAAENGFWDLAESRIESLAKRDYGVAVAEKTFAEVLFELCKTILQCDDDKALVCIERRAAYNEVYDCDYEAAVASEEFGEVSHPDDVQDAAKHVDRVKKDKERTDDLDTFVHGFLSKRRNAAQAKAKAKGAPKAQARAPRPPIVWPDLDGISPAWVQTQAPAGCRVRKDPTRSQWRLWFRRTPDGPWRSVGRSWTIRTQQECIEEILAEAWLWANL